MITQQEYLNHLERLETFFSKPLDELTPEEAKELDTLNDRIEEYENLHFPTDIDKACGNY